MLFKRLQKFPGELAKKRQQAGRRQGDIARISGIDPSVMCGIERGRRPPPADEIIVRMATAMECSPNARDDLLRAAAHDRLISSVLRENKLRRTAELISTCLSCVNDLSDDELMGLVKKIEAVCAAKTLLNQLMPQNASITDGKETAMS